MTVKDEEGNERELRTGDLVKVRRDGYFVLSRVLYTWLSGDDGYVDHCSAGRGICDSAGRGDVTWLSSEPPDDDKGMPLHERHKNLRRNLARARDRTGGGIDYSLLNKLVDYLQYPTEHKWFWWSVAESCDDPRQVSYATSVLDVDNNIRRTRCRMSKFLKGIARRMGFEVTNEEADRIGELVGNHFPDNYDYEFEIVREAVSRVYATSCGNIRSCMTGSSSEYTKWYDDNPDKVGIVKILQGGEYIGRALIWNTDQGPTVVDRAYPSDNGPHTNALHEWCEANGYDYKTSQCSGDGCLKSRRGDYTVTMAPSRNGTFPYLDTFKYTDDDPEDSETITLALLDGAYSFQCTGGGYDGGNRTTCEGCGDRINEDTCETSDGGYCYCSSCYEERFVYLSYTRPNGRYVEREFHRDDVCECENCNDTFSSDHTSEVQTGSRYATQYWCERCIEDDATSCCECSTIVADDAVATDSDGDAWCSSCFDNKCAVCEGCGEASLKTDMFDLDGKPICSGCIAEGDELPPLVEPVTQVTQPAPQVQQVGPVDDWQYPPASAFMPNNSPRLCACHWCPEIVRRRREYFRRCWSCPSDDDHCPICRIDGLTLDQYVAAPYPNAHEREILAQQAVATAEGASNPPPAEGAINSPSTNPFWAGQMSYWGIPIVWDVMPELIMNAATGE